MNAARSWRRIGNETPSGRRPWADAMRHELDYVAGDAAALRWAFGAFLASCRAGLR